MLNSDAQRLSLALAAARLGDWSWDAATDVVTLSPRAAEIFGIPSGPQMTWAAMRTLLHADDAERARLAVEHAVETRTDYAIEYRVVHDGDQRWVSASGRGVYDGAAVVGMLGVVQDITEYVRTRERLRLEAESLETINRVGQLLSAQLDLQPLVQSVTDAATELSGAEFGAFFYNVIDAKGESYMLYTLSGVPAEAFSKFPMPRSTDVFAPTFRGEGVIRLDDVRKDSRFGKNAPHYGMPKGHLPVVSYLAVPVIGRSGEVIGGLFFGHSQPGKFDERAERIVTGLAGQAAIAVDNARLFEEQRRTLDALALSEARFREVASTNSSLTLYEQDRELRYTWVFPRHEEHFNDNIGKTDEELLPPSEGAKLATLKRACLESGKGGRHEISVTLPTGERFYDLVVEPRRDASGAIVGVGGVAVDITELKNNERLLQRAQQAAHDGEARLRDADRRKDEFLAMLAHELRNPLAPIRTGLHLLGAGYDSPDAIAQVRGMMERQVGHIVRLVDDLLDVSRITSGKIQLRLERIALTELIDQAIEPNRAAISAAGLHLHAELGVGSSTVLVDPTRMVQVIANVLNNAVKFSRPGGDIRLSARIEGDVAIVTIADDGAGIEKETLPHIFELFVQGETAGGRTHGGLGIGLALAWTLIDMHGGSIEAASGGVDRGSTFTIRIPGVAAATPAVVKVPERTASLVNRRVLIVDDNDDATEFMSLLVQRLGGEVRTAADGETALVQAAEFAPEIILLDIGLPGIDGYETCRRLRQQPGRRPMIAALTGWGQEQDKRRAIEAGFDRHLTKPVDPVALESLLAKAATEARSVEYH